MSDYKSNRPKRENTRKKQIFYIGLIAGLIILNGLLFYTNIQKNKGKKELEAERNELLAEKAEYENQIDSLQTVLLESKGLNIELDSIINRKIRELDEMENTFDRKLSEQEYEIAQLRKELAQKVRELKDKSIAFTNEINQLKKKFDVVVVEKSQLKEKVDQQVNTIEELEKELDKGTILSAINIDFYGVQLKSGGSKEKRTDKYKKVDKLMVCFNISENRLANSGMEEILMRIISPEGSTVAIQALGSGTFKLAESGENSLYTSAIPIDFDVSELSKQYCGVWVQDMAYQTGIYTIQLYQKGYLIGQSDMELKKGGIF